MQRQYPIQIYTTYKNQIPKITFIQHDTEVNRIYFLFFDDTNIPMTGIYTATLTVKRADGNTYTYGMNDNGRPVFIIEDNFVTVIFPPGAVFAAGECQASISLYDTDMGRLSTETFKYTVKAELIADTPIDETDNYPILTELINETTVLKEAYQGAIDGSVVAQDHIEIVAARKGKETLLEKINEIDTNIDNLGTSIENVDAKADKIQSNANEVANIIAESTKAEIDRITALPNPLITKDVDLSGSVNLMLPTTVKSYQKTINMTNGGSAFNVRADNVTIEETAFSDASASGTAEIISIGGNDNISVNNNNIKNSKTNGVTVDLPNARNIRVTENKINADSYGVLINEAATDAKNAIITENEIYSYKADPVALNNPPSGTASSNDPNRVFHNGVVANNILTCDDGSTSTYSGFAASVADTHNVAVVANVSPYSRTEGLHFEGTEENVLAIGNVLDDCKGDGAGFLNITRTYNAVTYNGESVILAMNHFKKKNLAKTGIGIKVTNDGSGKIDNNVFIGNVVRGFDTGVYADGQSIHVVDKNIIKDCNTAVKTYANSRLIGKNVAVRTPILIDSVVGNGAIVDKIYADVPPTKIINTGGSGNRFVASKGFYWRQLTSYPLASNAVATIPLFELPKAMQGKLYVELYGNNALDTLMFIADVVFNGTTYTLANILNIGKNALAGKTIALVTSGSNVALQITTPGTFTDTSFRHILEFDGYYLK